MLGLEWATGSQEQGRPMEGRPFARPAAARTAGRQDRQRQDRRVPGSPGSGPGRQRQPATPSPLGGCATALLL